MSSTPESGADDLVGGFFTLHKFIEAEARALKSLLEQETALSQVVARIEAILDFMTFHFDIEEKIMQKIDFPYRTDHMRDHRVIKSRIDQIRHQLGRSDVEAARRFADVLHVMVNTHAFYFDLPLESAVSVISEASPNYLIGIIAPAVEHRVH